MSYWQKKMYSLKSLWIKASAKCINVNVKVWAGPVNSCHCLKQGGWDLHFLSTPSRSHLRQCLGHTCHSYALFFFTKVSPRPVGDTQLSHAVKPIAPSVQLIHQLIRDTTHRQSHRRKISSEIYLPVSAATIRIPVTLCQLLPNVLKDEFNDCKQVNIYYLRLK